MNHVRSTRCVRALDRIRTGENSYERRYDTASTIGIGVWLECSGDSLVAESNELDLEWLTSCLKPGTTLNCLVRLGRCSVHRCSWHHHDVAIRCVLLAREL